MQKWYAPLRFAIKELSNIDAVFIFFNCCLVAQGQRWAFIEEVASLALY